MSQQPLCKRCGSSYGVNPECLYCGTQNDVDLYIDTIDVVEEEQGLNCPICNVSLEKVSISNITLKRCPKCYLKLSTRQLVQHIAMQKIPHIYSINRKKLTTLSNSNYHSTRPRLKECPQCKTLMHREPLIKGSNIGIDECYTCKQIILDNGQLLQMLEWRKAGGENYTPSVVRAENVDIRGESLVSVPAFKLSFKLIITTICLVVSAFILDAIGTNRSKKIISQLIPIYEENRTPSYLFDIKRKKEYKYSQKSYTPVNSIKTFYDDYFVDNIYWDSIIRNDECYIFTTETTALAVVFPDQYYDKITYILRYRSFISHSAGTYTFPAEIDIQISH